METLDDWVFALRWVFFRTSLAKAESALEAVDFFKFLSPKLIVCLRLNVLSVGNSIRHRSYVLVTL